MWVLSSRPAILPRLLKVVDSDMASAAVADFGPGSDAKDEMGTIGRPSRRLLSNERLFLDELEGGTPSTAGCVGGAARADVRRSCEGGFCELLLLARGKGDLAGGVLPKRFAGEGEVTAGDENGCRLGFRLLLLGIGGLVLGRCDPDPDLEAFEESPQLLPSPLLVRNEPKGSGNSFSRRSRASRNPFGSALGRAEPRPTPRLTSSFEMWADAAPPPSLSEEM